LRVAFVLQDLQLSGGVGVIVEHARHLRADHGIDAQLVLAREELHPRWPFRGLDEVPVLGYEEALAQQWDIGVATWWQTTSVLFHLQCERYAYFIQALEDSLFRPEEPERIAAALTTALPVRFITEAQWIVEMIDRLQPGNSAHYVRNGIAKDVFPPPAAVPDLGDGPLRVVIEGARDVPLKGIDQALEAAALMAESAHVTWVAPHGTTDTPAGVDRVLSRLTHAEMAELFSESHVLLKLSRAEGMYGPPLEAFHCGATVVTTAVTGHDEYVRHGDNGLVVGWDDVHGTARALDLLARDRDLLAGLRAAALETARQWPDWPECAAALSTALRQIAADPSPPLRGAAQRLASELGTVTAELQLRDREVENAWASEQRLRSEKAWIWAMRARGRYHRVRDAARRIKPR
jgi:glycosyltransferase involved in cell wall biosynthesis